MVLPATRCTVPVSRGWNFSNRFREPFKLTLDASCRPACTRFSSGRRLDGLCHSTLTVRRIFFSYPIPFRFLFRDQGCALDDPRPRVLGTPQVTVPQPLGGSKARERSTRAAKDSLPQLTRGPCGVVRNAAASKLSRSIPRTRMITGHTHQAQA